MRASSNGGGAPPVISTYTDTPMPSCFGPPEARRDACSGAKRRVVGCCEHPVERALVVADVVGRAGDRGVRPRLVRDEVLAPHVDRIHPDLGRVHVEDALHRCGRLGTARTAVRDDRRGVREDGLRRALELGHGVHGRAHHLRHEEREDRADLGVAAGVLEDLEPIRLDLAVAGAADRHLLELPAAVAEHLHALGAALEPAHRPAHMLREQRRAAAPRGTRRSSPRSRRRRQER